ncbi:MAG TPA: translation initiation factor IF-2 [bacterium]|nr:translation initiation factor IF-2 [bacterium]
MAKNKKRIYEYAKDLHISSTELMKKLKFMGIRVSNTFNAVDEDVINQIKSQMGLHLFDDLDSSMDPFMDEPLIPQKPSESGMPKMEFKAKKKEAPPAPKPAPAPPKPATPKPAPPKPAAPAATPQKPAQPQKQAVSKPSEKQAADAPKPAPRTSQAPPPPRPPKQFKSGAKQNTGADKRPEQEKKYGQKPSGAQQRPPHDSDFKRSRKPEPRTDRDKEPIEKIDQPKKFKKKDISKVKEVVKKEKRQEASSSDGKPATGPSKRLEAIKQRGYQTERRGTKTTFIKKKTKKEKKDSDRDQTGELEMPQVRKRMRVSGPMTVREVANALGAKSSDIIMFLMKELNLMSTLNQSLDLDVIKLIAEHFDCTMYIEKKKTVDETPALIDEDTADVTALTPRAPVVTVLGHVDHGKTKLLDAIRHTNVVDKEFGGITQHIGAYQIIHEGRKIAFLDTPGHAAFTQLRARGAKVTDLAVLIVAADDGVMPQTLEAIDHAREAKVPILVAINKIDKPAANPDRIRQQLSDKGLIPEEWGGDTVCVEISAKMNQNIDELLDMIFLMTDMMELKAQANRKAIGWVIEAKLDKGKGPVATLLVRNGTLHNSDYIVVGTTYGKVRAMENERGERMNEAEPSTPVEVQGLNSVPEAGDQFFVIEDEKTAKEIATSRLNKFREEKLHYDNRVTLDDLFNRIQENKINELKIVLKGDVQGSIEAIVTALESIKHEAVRVNVIRSGVGEIKETDIMLAAASNAIVLGYNITINQDAAAQANNEKVEVRNYEIIYQLIDDVKRAMAGMLAPEYEEMFSGRAEVRAIFASSRFGNIAGCMITDGEVKNNQLAKILRDGKEISQDKVISLRRFKDSVKSVAQGFECGITLGNYSDFQEGDIIETFSLVEKKIDMID